MNAAANLKRELALVEQQERRFLTRRPKEPVWKTELYAKIPPGLRSTLEKAFAKAFEAVFLHGTGVIEKTFDREALHLEFEAGDFIVEKYGTGKTLRRLEAPTRKNNLMNSAVTTASGLGMGLLGFGLPDIPLLVGTLLKGVYQAALSFGFSYDTQEERIYILRLVRTALAPGGEREDCNHRLENSGGDTATLTEEITLTAKTLSDGLLLEKFIQGLPIVGVVGGAINPIVYRKVSKLAALKYKKRYLKRLISQKPTPSSP